MGRAARVLILASLLSISLLSIPGDFPLGYGQAGGKDLVPVEIGFDRSLPIRKGDIIEVTTTIENRGSQAVGSPLDNPIKVKFIYVGADVNTGSRSGPFGIVSTKRLLRPGEKVTLTARLDTLAPQRYLREEHPELSSTLSAREELALIPGRYNIYVQVDPDSEIKGENPDNNTISTPAAGPDLVILEWPTEPDLVLKTILFSRGPIISPKETFLISASIYNGGTADAGNSEIDFFKRRKGESEIETLGSMETGELLRSTAQEALAKTLPTIFHWDPGVYNIQAWVDYRNEISELDEGNNLQSNTLFIVDTARMRWAYPSFPIPIEDKVEEKIGAITASPAVAQVGQTTVVYFGSDDGYLYAIDSFGRFLWRYQTGGAVKTAPVIAQGMILFGSDDGNLYALDSNGDLEWKYQAGGPVKAAPAVRLGSGGEISAIYFGSDDGSLYALNADGSLRWQFTTGAFIRTTPAVTTVIEGGVQKTLIFFGSGDGNLYALEDRGDKAELRWTFPTGSFIKSSPKVAGQTVYFGSSDGHLYALFLDGTKKWEYPQQGGESVGAVESAPLIVEEDGQTAIYFGTNDGALYKLEEDEQGELSEGWRFNDYQGSPLGPIRCSPVRQEEEEIVYFGSDDGTLYAIEDRGRSVSDRWVFPTRGAITGSPAIDGNVLYLPSWEGHLYALNLGG